MTGMDKADAYSSRLIWSDLDPSAVRKLVALARQEDLEGWGLAKPPTTTGDVTSRILQSCDSMASARLTARENLVICGLELVQIVLDAYGGGARFVPLKEEGDLCSPGDCLGILTGPTRILLEAERILLNFLQRLSGIASTTHRYVDSMGSTRTRLLDTRKTTPGYRVLEKYAVACGGGYNHRMGLFDRVMLKDNHLAADTATMGDALSELVRSTRQQWPDMVIELEVDHLEQIDPALAAGVDIILLDNFSKRDLFAAISMINGAAATEASGGITLESLPGLSDIGLDFISTGATVHQSTWKDIGLDWEVDA